MFPADDYPGDDTTHNKSHIPKIMFLASIGLMGATLTVKSGLGLIQSK